MLSKNNISIQQIQWEAFSHNTVLKKNATYVFKVDIEKYRHKTDKDYSRILSANELTKANRFRQDADKKRFVTGRVLVKDIISKICLTDMCGIDFEYTESNKPFLKGIEFNIAHSGKYVLIGISNSPIGIDVELMDNNFDYDTILHNVFNTDEIDFIKDNANQKLNFYTLWTRKEALLKATGEGLTDNLQEVNILNNVAERNNTRYFLTSFEINGHMACLATSTANPVNYLEY